MQPQQQGRSKTLRRKGVHTPATDTPGPFVSDSVAKATEDSLDALFAAEIESNFHQPWQKLDRGSRLDRLRKFVQNYPDLSLSERASLLSAVVGAFEARQLNTKASLEYDPVSGTIRSIRGLRERISSTTGLRSFRVDSSATATATTAGAASAVAATARSTVKRSKAAHVLNTSDKTTEKDKDKE